MVLAIDSVFTALCILEIILYFLQLFSLFFLEASAAIVVGKKPYRYAKKRMLALTPLSSNYRNFFFRDTLLTKAFYKIDAASTLNDSLFTGKDLLIDIYPSNLNNDTYYFLGRDFIPEVGLKEHLKYYYQGATLRFIFADNVPNSLYQTGDKKASIVLTEPSSSTIPPDLFCIKYFKDGGTTYFAGQFKTILSYRRKPIPIE